MKTKVGPFEMDEGEQYISETFGWTDKAFDILTQLIATHLFKGFFSKTINTKTQAFADFVEKNPTVMEKCNTPNDYFVMGMAFTRAMNMTKEIGEDLKKAIERGEGGIADLFSKVQSKHGRFSSDDDEEDIKERVAKKLKALGIEGGEMVMEKITAHSPEEAAEKIAEKIIENKAEERKKNAPKKTINKTERSIAVIRV